MWIHPETQDAQVLAAVDEWADVLALGDYVRASEMVGHEPGPYRWTADLMERTINGYGFPSPHPSGEVFVVTPRQLASGRQHYREVDRQSGLEPDLLEVLYDLPLNDQWSDLTAMFRLRPTEDAHRLVLTQLRVL